MNITTKYDLGMRFYVTLGKSPRQIAELHEISVKADGISYVLKFGACYWTLNEKDIDGVIRGESGTFEYIEN
jgi:hypothetical protein